MTLATYECPRCGKILETLRGIDHHMRECNLPAGKRKILMAKFEALSDERRILRVEEFVTKSNLKVMAEETCQVCFGKEGGVDLHHIVRKSDLRHDADDISNLVVLCGRCHDRAEEARRYREGILGGVPKRLERYTFSALHDAQLNYVSPRGQRRGWYH